MSLARKFGYIVEVGIILSRSEIQLNSHWISPAGTIVTIVSGNGNWIKYEFYKNAKKVLKEEMIFHFQNYFSRILKIDAGEDLSILEKYINESRQEKYEKLETERNDFKRMCQQRHLYLMENLEKKKNFLKNNLSDLP